MRIYYTDETLGEYILRLATKAIAWYTILVLVGICISMGIHVQKLNSLDIKLNNIVYEERIPVKQQFMADIKKMPFPNETTEETIKNNKENETDIKLVEEETDIIASTSTTTKMNYKKSEVDLLAHLMYAEEGIFIYKLSEVEAKYVCQLAGSVVIHRKNMNYGGAKTIEEVIYADEQYTCVENGSINQEVPNIVYEWAEELLQNGPIGPKNMIYQAQFEQGSEIYDKIGNQYFCLK